MGFIDIYDDNSDVEREAERIANLDVNVLKAEIKDSYKL